MSDNDTSEYYSTWDSDDSESSTSTYDSTSETHYSSESMSDNNTSQYYFTSDTDGSESSSTYDSTSENHYSTDSSTSQYDSTSENYSFESDSSTSYNIGSDSGSYYESDQDSSSDFLTSAFPRRCSLFAMAGIAKLDILPVHKALATFRYFFGSDHSLQPFLEIYQNSVNKSELVWRDVYRFGESGWLDGSFYVSSGVPFHVGHK